MTCAYSMIDINAELDELDREEFYRLKKVSNKKQRDTAIRDAEALAKKLAEQETEEHTPEGTDTELAADILNQDEDEDVIF
jgi:V-type H+-transporting ATPase subunit D